MKGIISTPLKMDMDTAMEHYSSELYYDAFNINVYEGTNLKKGIVSVEPGNSLIIELPSTVSFNMILYTAPFTIIGIHRIEDTYLIFSKDSRGDGQIWHFKPVNQIYNLYLKYAGKLNFVSSEYLRIRSRPLMNRKTAIYFVDGVNPLRHFILEEDLTNRSVDYFDIVPGLNYTSVKPTKVFDGGKLPSAKISYSIQLFNLDGKETKSSALSQAVVLYENNMTSWRGLGIKGSSSNTVSNKSVEVTITGVDTSYEYLRLISVTYLSSEADPVINIVTEYKINSSNIVIIDSGTSMGTLSVSEFNELGGELISPKDIILNSNYLIAANIKKSNQVSVNYDARAYRYDDDGLTRIYNNTTEYKTFSHNSIPVIPKEYSCINPSNGTLPNITYASYKYNGSRKLGGKGKNISYTFVLTPIIIGMGKTTFDTKLIGSFPIYNPFVYFDNTSCNPSTNPIISEKYRGYKRGEIYRFGIKFINSRGIPYFVEWIGDIKFPEVHDRHDDNSVVCTIGTDNIFNFPVTHTRSEMINGASILVTYALNLGIKFEVNNIPLDEYGKRCTYEIVRAERTESNKTRVAQGLLHSLHSTGTAVYPPPCMNKTLGRLGENDTNSFPIVTLDNKYLVGKYNGVFLTPDDKINKINITGGLSVNKVTNCTHHYFGNKHYIAAYGAKHSDFEVLFYKHKNDTDFSLGNPKVIIADFARAVTDITVAQSVSLAGVNFINALAVNNALHSLHGSSTLLGFDSALYPSNPSLQEGVGVIVDLVRPSIGQYGGDLYAQIQNTIYLGCNAYVNTLGAINSTVQVYGGDTYINFYEFHRGFYLDTTYKYNLNGEEDMGTYDAQRNPLSQLVIFAVETTTNLALRTANTFLKSQTEDYKYTQEFAGNYAGKVNGTVGHSQTFDLYSYNSGYNTENNIRKSFAKPINYLDDSYVPNQIRISDKTTSNDSTDALLKFKSLNFRLTEDTIHGLAYLGDNVAFFEETAVGIFAVDEQVAMSTENSTSLVIGKGESIGKHAYLTRSYGTIYKFSLIPLDGTLMFMDYRNKAICTIGKQAAVKLTGINTLLKQYINKDSYVHGIFDVKNDRVIFTINNPSNVNLTVSYHITGATFVSKLGYTPKQYIVGFNGKMVSINNTGLYEHDGTNSNFATFYGVAQKAYINLLLAPMFKETKRFSNIEMNYKNYIPEKLALRNSYQEGAYSLIPFPQLPTDSNQLLIRQRFNKVNMVLPTIKTKPLDRNARLFDNHLFETIYLIDDTTKARKVSPTIENITNYFDIVEG